MEMSLINYEYMKLHRFLIFLEIVTAADKGDDNKLEFFQKIIRTIMDYEKANGIHINDFYIRITELEQQEYLKEMEVTIERQTILNAILFAVYNNDIEMLNKIRLIPIQKSQLSQSEVGENLDYILNHSIDIEEYIMGEEERIVYNIKENKLEKRYIFNVEESKSYQRLRLKK